MAKFLADNKPLVVKILGVILGILIPYLNTKFRLNLSPDEVKMAQGAVISAILAYGFHQGMSDHGVSSLVPEVPVATTTAAAPATIIVTPAGGSDKQSS